MNKNLRTKPVGCIFLPQITPIGAEKNAEINYEIKICEAISENLHHLRAISFPNEEERKSTNNFSAPKVFGAWKN